VEIKPSVDKTLH